MYRFAGFLARPAIDRPDSLPDGGVWRSISVPFEGVGVRLAALIGQSPEPAVVQRLLREVGLHVATDWLYITYDCWAGRVDYVYGLGAQRGHAFGPVKESDSSKVQTAYVALMGGFGIAPADAMRFPPFTRGFWGEVQRVAAPGRPRD